MTRDLGLSCGTSTYATEADALPTRMAVTSNTIFHLFERDGVLQMLYIAADSSAWSRPLVSGEIRDAAMAGTSSNDVGVAYHDGSGTWVARVVDSIDVAGTCLE